MEIRLTNIIKGKLVNTPNAPQSCSPSKNIMCRDSRGHVRRTSCFGQKIRLVPVLLTRATPPHDVGPLLRWKPWRCVVVPLTAWTSRAPLCPHTTCMNACPLQLYARCAYPTALNDSVFSDSDNPQGTSFVTLVLPYPAHY